MKLTALPVFGILLQATAPLGFAQTKPPVVTPFDIRHMAAEVDDAPGYSLRSDGKGPYHWQDRSRVFENRLALFLCTEAKTCSTLPQAAPAGTEVNRVLLVDLSSPLEERAKKLGIIRSPDVTLIVFWGEDKTTRMIYSVSGIEGYGNRDVRAMPVGETHPSERTELRFFLDGAQHILQFGPWTAGHFQKNQGPLNGTATTEATIAKVDESRYTVRSGKNSVGRLWDNRHPEHPVDRGLYSFSFAVNFSAVPSE